MTRLWSEDGNASQESSVVERELLKKNLREKVRKAEQLDIPQNDFPEKEVVKKKKKKSIKTEEGDTVVDLDEDLFKKYIKSEPEDVNPKRKNKNNKSEQEDTHTDIEKTTKQVNENNSEQQTLQRNNIKQENEVCTLANRKKKKHKKAHGEVSFYDDSLSEQIIKQEGKPDSPIHKKSKKRKAQEEVQGPVDETQFQDESFSVPPNPKKRKKHKEPNNEIEIKGSYELDSNNVEIVNIYEKLNESTVRKAFDTDYKNDIISFLDNNSVDLRKEKSTKRLRKDSFHFDETNTTSIQKSTHKDSSSSSTVVLSSKHKTASSSGSEHQRSGTVPAAASRHSSSSSSDSDLNTSHTHNKGINKRKQSGSEIEYDKQKKSTSNRKTHVSLTEKIQFDKAPININDAVIRGPSSSSDSEGDSTSKANKNTVVSQLDQSRKRISLSEKIVFDEDIDDALNREKGNDSSNKNPNALLTRFMEKNPHLKYDKWNSVEGAIDSDDEVWVLQFPKDCEVPKLQDMDISLETKTKMKIEGQAYDGILEEGMHQLAILTSSIGPNKTEIKNVRPKGTVRFRKRIPKVHMTEAAPAPAWRDAFIPLPDTKRRHPLFGHEYKKFIKLPLAVAERLQHPPRRFLANRKHTTSERTLDQPVHEELTQEDVAIKKKKKKKKLKHDPDEVWDSEKAIEKSLFNF